MAGEFLLYTGEGASNSEEEVSGWLHESHWQPSCAHPARWSSEPDRGADSRSDGLKYVRVLAGCKAGSLLEKRNGVSETGAEVLGQPTV